MYILRSVNTMNTHLGRLEQQILQIVCARGNATVREVLSGKEMHRMAYSTVMTTLDRIYKKGFLDRTKEGRAFRYWARCTSDEVIMFLAVSEILHWIKPAPRLNLSYFVDALAGQDERLLDELQTLVEKKRRELKP